MRGTVIVTDGDQRAALATVRSLGAAGWRTIVAAPDRRSLAGASRHAAREVHVPAALNDPGAFTEAIAELTNQERADLIIPITEPSLLALLPARSVLAPARIPFPDAEHFRRISDKALLLETAKTSGIAVPSQTILTTRGELDAVLHELRYPVVLKPGRSVADVDGRREKLSVRHAANVDELRATIRAFSDAAFPLLLQQRIVGPGVGIFLLLWDGDVYAQFSHRRLREKPPSGGVSVYRESIAADPDLVRRSTSLLERFDWFGPAMIEYKVDRASGIPYLMEINGRFWGSLQLAIDAGVDFPVLLAQLALDERPSPVLDYTLGVRSRWWWGDVDHLLLRMRRSRESLALPPDAPSRRQALLDFLTLWRSGDRNEIVRFGDLRPALRETISWFRGR